MNVNNIVKTRIVNMTVGALYGGCVVTCNSRSRTNGGAGRIQPCHVFSVVVVEGLKGRIRERQAEQTMLMPIEVDSFVVE